MSEDFKIGFVFFALVIVGAVFAILWQIVEEKTKAKKVAKSRKKQLHNQKKIVLENQQERIDAVYSEYEWASVIAEMNERIKKNGKNV